MGEDRWSEVEYADWLARKGGSIIAIPKGPKFFTVPGEPIAKPRQTRSDKWKERPCVVRYREWADRAREHAGAIPPAAQRADIVAYLPLPASWSQRKRNKMAGMPHQQKPDIDNLIKSALDALLSRDQGIHEIRAKKRWADANGPRVEITIYGFSNTSLL